MYRTASLFTALATFLPLSVAAQPAGVHTFVDALRAQGCVLTDTMAEAFQSTIGLAPADLDDAGQFVVIEGLGELQLGGAPSLTLVPALCDPAAAGDIRATLVAALRMNGCRMTEAEAASILTGLGLTMEMTRDVAEAMDEAGELTVDAGTATLSAALCEGTGDVLPSPRGAVLTALRGAGCAMTEGALIAALEARGMDPAIPPALVADMQAQGDLVGKAGQVALTHDVCIAQVAAAPAPAPGTAHGTAQGPAEATDAPSSLDPVDEVVAMIREEGCQADAGAVDALIEVLQGTLPEDRLDAAAARYEAMLDLGDIFENDVLGTVVISDELCAGRPGRLPVVTGALIAATQANGCSLTLDEAAELFATGDVTLREIEIAGELMLTDGRATEDGDRLVLQPTLCAAAPVAE